MSYGFMTRPTPIHLSDAEDHRLVYFDSRCLMHETDDALDVRISSRHYPGRVLLVVQFTALFIALLVASVIARNSEAVVFLLFFFIAGLISAGKIEYAEHTEHIVVSDEGMRTFYSRDKQRLPMSHFTYRYEHMSVVEVAPEARRAADPGSRRLYPHEKLAWQRGSRVCCLVPSSKQTRGRLGSCGRW